MSRPSRNTDKMLIRAGREMLPAVGASGLNLREVADRAGVNLGMFHYHFKTKDEFLKKVLAEIYTDFFSDFKIVAEPKAGEDILLTLRRSLHMLADVARKNRVLLVSIAKDALNGERIVLDFIVTNVPKHVALIFALLREGQRQKKIKDLPIPTLMVFLAAGIVGPILMLEVITRLSSINSALRAILKMTDIIIGDKMIAARIDMGIAAVSVGRNELQPMNQLIKKKIVRRRK